MRVEAKVPRLQLKVVALQLLGLLLDGLNLLDGGRLVGFDKVVKQLVHILRVRRHAVYKHIVGVCVVAEKLCYLAAQVYKALAYLKVVLRIVVCTLRVACHI